MESKGEEREKTEKRAMEGDTNDKEKENKQKRKERDRCGVAQPGSRLDGVEPWARHSCWVDKLRGGLDANADRQERYKARVVRVKLQKSRRR